MKISAACQTLHAVKACVDYTGFQTNRTYEAQVFYSNDRFVGEQNASLGFWLCSCGECPTIIKIRKYPKR